MRAIWIYEAYFIWLHYIINFLTYLEFWNINLSAVTTTIDEIDIARPWHAKHEYFGLTGFYSVSVLTLTQVTLSILNQLVVFEKTTA